LEQDIEKVCLPNLEQEVEKGCLPSLEQEVVLFQLGIRCCESLPAQLEQYVEKVCLSSWRKMLRKSTKYLNMCSSFILKLQPCALLHFVSLYID
jgi:hypothetical protein